MSLREVLKTRDKLTDDEIDAEISYCRRALLSGEMSPEEACIDYLGVEEDYIFDIIGY